MSLIEKSSAAKEPLYLLLQQVLLSMHLLMGAGAVLGHDHIPRTTGYLAVPEVDDPTHPVCPTIIVEGLSRQIVSPGFLHVLLCLRTIITKRTNDATDTTRDGRVVGFQIIMSIHMFLVMAVHRTAPENRGGTMDSQIPIGVTRIDVNFGETSHSDAEVEAQAFVMLVEDKHRPCCGTFVVDLFMSHDPTSASFLLSAVPL